MKTCECGCVIQIKESRRFVHGHNKKGKTKMNCPSIARGGETLSKRIKGKNLEERYGIETAKKMKKNLKIIMKERHIRDLRERKGLFSVESRKKAMETRSQNPNWIKNVIKARKINNPNWGKVITKTCAICGKIFVVRLSLDRPTCGSVCGHKWSGIIQKGKKKHTFEHRKKVSQIITQLWRGEMGKKIWASLGKKPNKLEQKLINIIRERAYPLEYVGNGKIIIEGFCPDFMDNNGSKRIIEVFGEYWHKNSGEKDRRRIETFSKYGYKTLIVWEHELEDIELVSDKIEKFLGGVETEVFLR